MAKDFTPGLSDAPNPKKLLVTNE